MNLRACRAWGAHAGQHIWLRAWPPPQLPPEIGVQPWEAFSGCLGAPRTRDVRAGGVLHHAPRAQIHPRRCICMCQPGLLLHGVQLCAGADGAAPAGPRWWGRGASSEGLLGQPQRSGLGGAGQEEGSVHGSRSWEGVTLPAPWGRGTILRPEVMQVGAWTRSGCLLAMQHYLLATQWPFGACTTATQRPRDVHVVQCLCPLQRWCHECPGSGGAPVEPHCPAGPCRGPQRPAPWGEQRMSNATSTRAQGLLAATRRGKAAAKPSNYAKRQDFSSQGN